MELNTLPEPFKKSLNILSEHRSLESRVEAIEGNWAYVLLPNISFPFDKFPPPNERDLWIRLPLQFPSADPHGIVTREQIIPRDGHKVVGENKGHPMCKPVSNLGGLFYYSWTWTDEKEPAKKNPVKLSVPEDIKLVISWLERRIRIE